jgi:two-component system response regulator YesN
MNPLVKRVLEYMNNNYYKPISLKTIALQYRTNASYLGQIFKKETGEFFTDYLNIIRIEHSKKLLSKNDLRSSHISEMKGFSDPR